MLKPREEMVLRFVRRYRDERGIMPSMREIGAACGLRSTNTVKNAIGSLAQKGYVERYAYVARGFRLTDLGDALTTVTEAAEEDPA